MADKYATRVCRRCGRQFTLRIINTVPSSPGGKPGPVYGRRQFCPDGCSRAAAIDRKRARRREALARRPAGVAA